MGLPLRRRGWPSGAGLGAGAGLGGGGAIASAAARSRVAFTAFGEYRIVVVPIRRKGMLHFPAETAFAVRILRSVPRGIFSQSLTWCSSINCSVLCSVLSMAGFSVDF